MEWPIVDQYMTRTPVKIPRGASLREAQETMREFSCRHLPVVDGAKVVGIISERDVYFFSGFDDSSEITVGDAMTPSPYTVVWGTRLDRIAKEMAAHKYGSALVKDNEGQIIGIFTAVDALKALADFAQ